MTHMTKTKGEHFRCPDYVRDAILKEIAEKNRQKTEVIVRAICKALKIKYRPVEMGRPRRSEQP